MCAINGFLINHNRPAHLWKMNDANKFRGPDYSGSWRNNRVALGHNLLNINAVTAMAAQPVISPRGNILLYNGQAFGVDYFDTQYIVSLLDFGGVNAIKSIDGQFALAWYNIEAKTITLARDHFGTKPLFYIEDGGLLFSSSLHAIATAYDLEPHNPTGTEQFHAQSRFHLGRNTFYKNVYKLFPGEYRTYNVETGKLVRTGHLHDYVLGEDEMSDDDARDLIRETIKDVVKSPQKTAISLSGGLDSTAILSQCYDNSKIFGVTTTYRAEKTHKGVHVPYLEDVERAILTAEHYGIKHHETFLTKKRFGEAKEESLRATMMPTFDYFRTIPRFVAAQEAAKNGAKVFITGDGGDEIFTGYSGDNRLHDEAYLSRYTIEGAASWLDTEEMEWFPSDVLGDDAINNERFVKLMFNESYNFVNDAFASYFGMESRAPFMHQGLIRKMLSIPGHLKLRHPEGQPFDGTHKYYLRELFKDVLPAHVLEGSKAGFAAPWNSRNEKLNSKDIGDMSMCIDTFNLSSRKHFD